MQTSLPSADRDSQEILILDFQDLLQIVQDRINDQTMKLDEVKMVDFRLPSHDLVLHADIVLFITPDSHARILKTRQPLEDTIYLLQEGQQFQPVRPRGWHESASNIRPQYVSGSTNKAL